MSIESRREALPCRSQECLERRVNHFRRLAFSDALTRLPNLRAAQAELGRLRRASLPTRNSQLVVGMLDLKDFRRINNRHGQSHGNQALATVAASIHARIGAPNSLFRIGGDEFMIVLRELRNNLTLNEVKQRLAGPHRIAVAGRVYGVSAYVVTRALTARNVHRIGHLLAADLRRLKLVERARRPNIA